MLQKQLNYLIIIIALIFILALTLTEGSKNIPLGEYFITPGGCYCKANLDPSIKVSSYNFNFPAGWGRSLLPNNPV